MDIEELKRRLKVPVIAAPMLRVSGPDLVVAACRAGVVGSVPSLNADSADELRTWLERFDAEITPHGDAAPYAINLIVRAAERFDADLALIEAFRAPIVITSVGNPGTVVERVHAYGGLIFHDVATIRHAEKAAAAGVDGLILLTAGAGGHTGSANPFAFVRQVRAFWNGAIVLAGGISDGHAVRAAEALGADFAYMGTRFINTTESAAQQQYKDMIIDSGSADIVHTPAVSGIPANFMVKSLVENGIDPKQLPEHKLDMADEAKAWKTVWSAGQGAGAIHDILPAGALVGRLRQEFAQATDRFAKATAFV